MMQANDNMRPRTAGSRPKSANKSWQSGGGNANSGNFCNPIMLFIYLQLFLTN